MLLQYNCLFGNVINDRCPELLSCQIDVFITSENGSFISLFQLNTWQWWKTGREVICKCFFITWCEYFIFILWRYNRYVFFIACLKIRFLVVGRLLTLIVHFWG